MKAAASIEATLPLIRAGLYAMLADEDRAPIGGAGASATPRPFVTVSRQAGAGGRTFARSLAERLNSANPADRPWVVWDRELVTKVAQEQLIPAELTERLERRHDSRFEQLVAPFLPRDDPSMFGEAEVYRRVAQTIRALARAGRAVVVGRGGAYATRDLPGGVHVRLVAPFERRVAHMAAVLDGTPSAAAAEVRRLDRERDAIHRRYGGEAALLPEVFTVTLNTAAMSPSLMVDCVLPLIATAFPGGVPQPQPAAAVSARG